MHISNEKLKTYIISHHSQTTKLTYNGFLSLRPILFHIILKPLSLQLLFPYCLRPILFHIILKQYLIINQHTRCLRPILFHIILKHEMTVRELQERLRPILFHIILKQYNHQTEALEA